jgi:sterol desaturase/sphingolipid hydroxylase (fatty acid hydroxylase superfamily)
MTAGDLFGYVALGLAGWLAWTVGEYVLHRFAMHELRGKGMMSREHLNHHADRDSILEKAPLAWIGVIIVGSVWGWLLAPAFGVGWVFGYGFYDFHHWHAHKHPARNRYQRWLRLHHFHHHFGHPKDNLGVTWPVWDLVFGTYVRPSRIRLPRRLAMVWLVDDAGEVKPEYAAQYEVVGRPRPTAPAAAADVDERDRVDAFANRPPALV